MSVHYKHPRVLIVGGLAVALFLISFTVASGAPKNAGSKASSRELTSVSLRLDWLPQGYQAPFYVAEGRGYYRDAGLDVSVANGSGTSTTIKLVANGNDTFGFGSISTMAYADATSDVGLVAVGGIFQRDPDAIFVRTSTGITKPQQLAGHSIVDNPDRPLFPAFAKAVGLDPDSVKFLSVGSADKTTVFINGRGDALDQFVTVAFRLRQAGIKFRVFPYPKYGVGVLSQGLMAQASYVKAHPDVVQAFVTATMKGLGYTIEHPRRAIQYLAKYQKQSSEDLEIRRAELNASLPLLFTAKSSLRHPLGYMSAASWKQTLAIMKKYQEMPSISPAEVYTNQFATKADVKAPTVAAKYVR